MKLEELHEKLFEMLCMFDKLCKENGITYFLDSGTAIGAVREHDFIPWDDDVDVAIMRSEYEKLRLVLKEKLAPNYRLIEPEDYSPYFFDFIPKLIDTGVPLREETDEDRAYRNYQNRMAIDFFILDSVPDPKWRQSLIRLRSKLIYGLARSKRYAIHTQKLSFLERTLSGICFLVGKLFPLKTLIQLYVRNTVQYANQASKSLIRSNSILYFIDFFQKEDYSEAVSLPFHGKPFPLPKGYDRVLTKMYGDYMTPRKDYKGFVSHTNTEG